MSQINLFNKNVKTLEINVQSMQKKLIKICKIYRIMHMSRRSQLVRLLRQLERCLIQDRPILGFWTKTLISVGLKNSTLMMKINQPRLSLHNLHNLPRFNLDPVAWVEILWLTQWLLANVKVQTELLQFLIRNLEMLWLNKRFLRAVISKQ